MYRALSSHMRPAPSKEDHLTVFMCPSDNVPGIAVPIRQLYSSTVEIFSAGPIQGSVCRVTAFMIIEALICAGLFTAFSIGQTQSEARHQNIFHVVH
jgi:hypothetical protein